MIFNVAQCLFQDPRVIIFLLQILICRFLKHLQKQTGETGFIGRLFPQFIIDFVHDRFDGGNILQLYAMGFFRKKMGCQRFMKQIEVDHDPDPLTTLIADRHALHVLCPFPAYMKLAGCPLSRCPIGTERSDAAA